MENPVQDQERFFAKRYVGKSYYDSPEGKDLDVKLFHTTKIGGALGLVGGTIYAYCIEPTAKGHQEKLFRIARVFIPCVGMAAAFTLATYFSTNIRKKDDEFNYFLGGVAAGTIFGTATRSFFRGLYAGLAFGVLATFKKQAQDKNTVVFPKIGAYGTFSSYYIRNWDFTVLKDEIRGNWTRDPK